MTSSVSISKEDSKTITSSSSSPLLTLPDMAKDIKRVNEELKKSVQSKDSFLTEVATHLINAGGKRVRPALSITSSLLSEENPQSVDHDVIRGAVAVELVHQGSLYHDDVMDDLSRLNNIVLDNKNDNEMLRSSYHNHLRSRPGMFGGHPK